MHHKQSRFANLFLALAFATFVISSNIIQAYALTEDTLPKYSVNVYEAVNDNEPEFSDADKSRTDAFETYSDFDDLGRCGVAYANICTELQPTEERKDISTVHPTGWQSGMAWERCHLIGFQLAGENANKQNLITGTHYLNVIGMLPFENMVDDYVEETNNHVLYRVTPYFVGDNLVADGVQMEAWSVEDEGDGICFNIYVFNVTPGKTIDYKTGVVTDSGNTDTSTTTTTIKNKSTNTSTDKVTVEVLGKTVNYNGEAVESNPATVTGSDATVEYTYYSDSACKNKTAKTKSGCTESGSALKLPGIYYVRAKVGKTLSEPAKITINKGIQMLEAANSSFTVDVSQLSANHTFDLGISGNVGTLSFSKTSGDDSISVSSDGTVTIDSNSKSGNYIANIKVVASETSEYNMGAKSVTISVNVQDSSSDNSNMKVYVSSGGIIHTKPDCSGMKKYTEMTYSEAIADSKNKTCKKCF